MASPMPVLPLVGSTIEPPLRSLPERSASSIIESAIRSLIEPPGLERSDLLQTSAPPNSRFIRICGVLPIVSQMLAAFMSLSPWRLPYHLSRACLQADRSFVQAAILE